MLALWPLVTLLAITAVAQSTLLITLLLTCGGKKKSKSDRKKGNKKSSKSKRGSAAKSSPGDAKKPDEAKPGEKKEGAPQKSTGDPKVIPMVKSPVKTQPHGDAKDDKLVSNPIVSQVTDLYPTIKEEPVKTEKTQQLSTTQSKTGC